MSAGNDGIALAKAIHAAIAGEVEVRSEDGFADAMAAIVVVAVGVIATAGGDTLAHLQAGRMISRHVLAGLLDSETRAEALALLDSSRVH